MFKSLCKVTKQFVKHGCGSDEINSNDPNNMAPDEKKKL
jgi:hypothetical protein